MTKKLEELLDLPDSKELIDAFGVWGKKKYMGKEYEGVLRTTFIIDKNGIIENFRL